MHTPVLASYRIATGKLAKPVVFAVVSDLHNEPYERLWPLVDGADGLLVPGDVTDRYRQGTGVGEAFLRDAAKRLPTFFSLGNHEARQKDFRGLIKRLEDTGAEILLNRYVPFGQTFVGGWYDPKVIREPDMLDAFERLDGCKVLMCHKPEHYFRYLRERDADLVVAGHAHGGQVRLFGRGLFAPGQLFFPKYTRGLTDGRLVISAGVGNPIRLPRWNNPPEVLHITLE